MVNTISAEIEPFPGQANQAALVLQRLGFQVLHIGSTISVQAPQALWESTFNVSFEPQKKNVIAEIETGEVTYQNALTENMHIPQELQELISGIFFIEPPQLY